MPEQLIRILWQKIMNNAHIVQKIPLFCSTSLFSDQQQVHIL